MGGTAARDTGHGMGRVHEAYRGLALGDLLQTQGRRRATVRVTRDIDAAEEAVQEAYVQALRTWHTEGVPSHLSYATS